MDYYAILGVAKTATPDEIKKAYRKLASQHHPDKGGDKAMFQNVQEAYSVLSDPDKRARYDNPQPQEFNMGPGGFQWNVHGMDLNDIFNQMFNQNSGMHRNSKQTFRTNINISLLEAYNGINKVLEMNTQSGKKIIDIKIPPGIRSGDQMRYDNVLDNAFLLVEFGILPDLKFDRKGNDLYCNQPIDVLDLITGTSIEFETIASKKLQVHIKPKTQPYMTVKLAGHGMPIVNTTQFGDQYLLLKPYIPDNISQEIIDSILHTRSK